MAAVAKYLFVEPNIKSVAVKASGANGANKADLVVDGTAATTHLLCLKNLAIAPYAFVFVSRVGWYGRCVHH